MSDKTIAIFILFVDFMSVMCRWSLPYTSKFSVGDQPVQDGCGCGGFMDPSYARPALPLHKAWHGTPSRYIYISNKTKNGFDVMILR